MPLNLTVDDVLELSEREVYVLVDKYLKSRLSDYVQDNYDREILLQRNLNKDERSEEYEPLLHQTKKELKNLLYDGRLIMLLRTTLERMESAVKKQLREFEDNTEWREGAFNFLRMVQAELANVRIEVDEILGDTLENKIDILLKAIEAHKNAEDADEADERLYDIASQISEEIQEEVA